MRNVVQLISGNKSDIERDLVRGCTRNDRIAQRDLYHKYCDAMFTIAYRIVSNRDDAHDALQDAFIQVFRDIGQYRFDSTLGAWIKTIVVRTSLKQLSKNRKLAFVDLDETKSNEMILIPDTLNSTIYFLKWCVFS